MELQFYPPGWVLWPPGNSCDATRWCAALNIDSLGLNMNTGQPNNNSCLETVGEETVNFAFITKNGTPLGPPGPPHPDSGDLHTGCVQTSVNESR